MCYFPVYMMQHHSCLYDSAKTTCFGKISFSSYIRKCSQPIRLQDFLSFNIAKTIWGIKFIFWMELSFHGSYSLIMWFSLGLVKHALSALKNIGNTDFEERFVPSMWFFGFKWYATFENLQKQHGCQKFSSSVVIENTLD